MIKFIEGFKKGFVEGYNKSIKSAEEGKDFFKSIEEAMKRNEAKETRAAKKAIRQLKRMRF